jgi:hypothetical protein
MAEGAPPPQTPDIAVRAYIGMFVLGAVLHGFDVMRPEGIRSSIMWWVIGGLLALFDWHWIRIKTGLGLRFAATANKVATDFRWWAISLIIVFAFVAASDIYRAVSEAPPPNPTAATSLSSSMAADTTTETPTWLHLDFDSQGTPKETASANLHWWWWNPTESGGLGSLGKPDTTTTVLFLSFDRPVKSDDLYLVSSSNLPRWEVAKRVDDRIAVIWIHGTMTGKLEIDVVK